jgi:hypothetical protein
MKVVFNLRRAEIIIIARRKGVADTPDLDRFLICWFWHRPISAYKDPVGALIHIAWRMGKDNFTAPEAQEIIHASKRGRPLYKADDLGEYLRLTDAERTAWGIRTIGAHDVSRRQRNECRKRKARERKARHRQERGATPHARSLSRTRPWEARGLSRATWYRLQRREAAVAHETNETDSSAISETDSSAITLYSTAPKSVSRKKKKALEQGGNALSRTANSRGATVR